MYTDVYEVLVRSIYAQQVYFVADWKVCCIRHGLLVVPTVSPRRALIRWVHSAILSLSTPSLTKSSVRNRESRAYIFPHPRTLQAFFEVCVKLGTTH